MNRVLIAIGLLCILAGIGWSGVRRIPLFRLPGDLVIDRPGVRFFLPVTSMLLISAVISLLAALLRK